MKEVFEAFLEFFGIVRAGWRYIETERQAFEAWLQNQSRTVRRQFRSIEPTIRRIAWLAFIWPLTIISVAMLCPPHVAHTVIAILALAPVVLLIWLATTWTTLLSIAAITMLPGNLPFIGNVISFLRKAITKLLLVLLGELVIGIYFAIVPVSADPGLVPLLILVALSLGVATVALGKGWVRTILILLIIGITAVFFLGGRDKAQGNVKDFFSPTLSANQSAINRTQLPAAYIPAPPRLTHVDIQDADPLICGKSADAYYYHSRFEANERRGEREGYRDPQFLFPANHEGNDVDWAGGFKGAVLVCFVVDERGYTTDIRLPQSPSPELEQHIKESVEAMRWDPGTYNREPVRVQVAKRLAF